MPVPTVLHDFDKLRVLADPRRMRILRLLMAAPATLTDLAGRLNQSPAWVRHHLLSLESVGLVELVEVRTVGKVTEKFYRARYGALVLQELILPESEKPVVVFAGSDDSALDWASSYLGKWLMLLTLPVGSLGGLINLRQGLCHISGCHLLDESGEYNLPFIRHFFPDRPVKVITLAGRTQGWMLAPGNPKGLSQVEDLARPKIRFVNRNAGSGTRLWIDKQLRALGIDGGQVTGYEREVPTHGEAASLIAAGKADISIGLQSAAHRHGLEFIPLFEERYDLVLDPEYEKTALPLLEYIQTSAFRTILSSLTGYSAAQSGHQILL
jgi:putative molybdopterin biosynthesis protein